jgi:preprotein translocase subunit YajC
MNKKQVTITAALLAMCITTVPASKANAATAYPCEMSAVAEGAEVVEMSGRITDIDRVSETTGFATIVAEDGNTYVTETPITTTSLPASGLIKIRSTTISGETTFVFTWGSWEFEVTISVKVRQK